ncbi:hypothetical protein C7B79_09890 [Chroococcidiopsis cubana CCALA 043]|uniref:GAF domain-containing protein n=1 Tax=Chroococcidiopsis cubana TaxID=171392 RepID=UPI000D077716|nr:GAF domain-containing protein [Chroococcidiopsis cubana]PSB64386.1 hypothetical protein C7B79_09890 [Chroococcidiopsis cubana CCALA 043]
MLDRITQLQQENDRLQAELAQLRDSEKRYRTLFELSSEGIVRFGYKQPIPLTLSIDEQLELCYRSIYVAEANDAYARMFEYEKGKDTIGLTLNDLHDRNSEVTQVAMRDWIENQYTCRSLETVEFDRHGRKRYFLNSAASTIVQGCVVCTWTSQVDITQLRETQQALLEVEQARVAELTKANEALRNAIAGLARLDSLDSFLAEMLKVSLEVSGAHSGAVCLIEGDMVRHAVLFDKVGWVPPEIQEQRGTLLLPFSPELRLMAQRILESESAWAVLPDDPLHPPSFQAFHREQGNRAIRLVPMRINDRLLGWLGLGFAQEDPPLGKSFALLRVLAEQMTMAVEMLRLAEEAKQSALAKLNEVIAREQEKAALSRAAELARSNEALQQTIDTLGSLSSFDEFIPAVLKIVAQTFKATDCGYYEHSQDEIVYLRYWFSQGTVLNPTELQLLDPQQHPVLLRLINGFTVPLEHLQGTTVRNRTRSVIIDHTIANTVPEFHTFAVSQGWELELNQPLLVDGKADGALIVYRKLNQPFTEAEITLAETLAKQLALAMQASRLAHQARDRAVETAIAREQEKAAQARSAELERANNTLQSTVAALADRRDLDGFIGEVLHTIANEFESPLVEYWTVLGTDTVEINTWLHDNRLCSLKQNDEHPGCGGIRLLSELYEFEDFTHRRQPFVFNEPMPAYSLALGQVICPTEWYAERRVSKHFNFSLQAGNTAVGAITVWLPLDRQITEECLRLGQALSHQTALAIQLTQLAEEAKQVAIAREQEKAAQERAAELAKANEALARTSSRLAEQPDLSSFLGHITMEAIAQLGADAGHLTILNEQRQTLCTVAHVEQDRLLASDRMAPEMPIAEAGFLQLLLETRKPRYFDLEQEAHLFWPGAIEYHRQRHHCAVLSVPLFAGGNFLGHLGLAFTHSNPISEQGSELLQALSHQAALAIQLTQLAEEAKQVAIAREQEKAAQEQVAELVKANNALRRSVCHLTTDNLYRFLIATLQEAIQASDATSGAIFVYQPASDTLQVTAIVLRGEVINIATDPRAELWRFPIPIDVTPFWQQLQNQEIVWSDLEQPCPQCLWQFSIAWHQQQGHQTIPMIPMAIGEQVLGFVGLAFTTKQKPTEFRFEQCRTFAHHAALALQMADLMQQAKQNAVLEERNRMARDIHDSLAQAFTGIILQLEAAKRKIAAQPEAAQNCLLRARSLAASGLSEARRSVRALRPEALESDDLPSALRYTVEQMSWDTKAQIQLQIDGVPRPIPTDVEVNLLRIGQEAITNALRHADAPNIRLNLLFEPEAVHLQIRDDGRGFQPQIQLTNGGFGLIGMQERSSQLGGQLRLVSSIGQGTEIVVTVPI